MIILLIRHAVAVDREVFAKKNLDDRLRPLTIKGKKRMFKVLARATDFIKKIDLIVSSPLVRAQQTTQLVSQVFSVKNILEAPELAPEVGPQAFANWLKLHARQNKVIAVVGHEPNLSYLASWFLTGTAEKFTELKKGGIMAIEVDSVDAINSGQLLFLISPRILLD